MAGGTFGVSRAVHGGASANAPSRYYIGFWPCQQAAGDADAGQVTDRSGKGAHATIGNLTPAEAWSEPGFLSSLAEASHFGEIPLEKWTHRFTEGSLILAGWTQMEKQASSRRWMGHGSSDAITGFAMAITPNGAIQVNVVGVGGVNAFSSATSQQPWSTDSLHAWFMAYDMTDSSISIGIDGVIVQDRNKQVTPAQFAAADGSVSRGPAIGGRSGVGSGTTLVPNATRFVHALDFPGRGLPASLAAICWRLYTHPREMLRDEDLI